MAGPNPDETQKPKKLSEPKNETVEKPNPPKSSTAVFSQPTRTDSQKGLSLEAADSWVVLSGGPRGGENAKKYLNLQGRATGRFSSYGLIEFLPTARDRPESPSLSPERGVLRIAQSVARFSRAGSYSVYLVGEAVDIGVVTNLSFNPAEGVGGIDPVHGALGTLIKLRDREYFSPVSTGHVNEVGLKMTKRAAQVIENSLRDQTPIFVLLVADDPEVAATFAGSASSRAEVARLDLFFD